MSCSVCGSIFHLEDDNWQCRALADLMVRVAALEAQVLELSQPPKLVTEVSTNG
jgi:hypothetical protein